MILVFLIVYICIRYVRYSKEKSIKERNRPLFPRHHAFCDPPNLTRRGATEKSSPFHSFEW